MPPGDPKGNLLPRLCLQTGVWLAIMAALLLGGAENAAWPQGLIYLAIFTLGSVVFGARLLKRDPALLAARLGASGGGGCAGANWRAMRIIARACVTGSCRKSGKAIFSQHGIKRHVVIVGRQGRDFLSRIGDADRRHLEQGDGAVIKAAAITQAMALGVEGQQRHQQKLRDGA